MNGEFLFFILFLLIFFIGSLIRGYYGRKIPLEGSPLDRLRKSIEKEGQINMVILILLAFILLFGFFLYVSNIWFLWFPWTQLLLPNWLRWLGVIFGLVSIPFLFWVHYTLQRYWDVSLQLHDQHVLITTGPYSQIRHPMYTIHIFYFLAFFLVSANWLFLINWLLTLVLIARRIPREEQMMLAQFGDAYRDYISRTGSLVPKLRRRSEINEKIGNRNGGN